MPSYVISPEAIMAASEKSEPEPKAPAVKKCGRFTYDPATKNIAGPAEYMRERGNARIDRIVAGTDASFNVFASYSPDTATAVLVCLQTDYAAWAGAKEAEGWISR